MKRIIRAGTVLFVSLLASNAVALDVGDMAPNFTTTSTRGVITLNKVLMAGPVVLALYYADFTPG